MMILFFSYALEIGKDRVYSHTSHFPGIFLGVRKHMGKTLLQ